MKARFLDQHGPLHARTFRYAIAVALAAGLAATATSSVGAFIGLLIVFLPVMGLVPAHQRKAKSVEIVTGPGWVDVRGAGLRRQRIRAKAIVGGSTAKTADGVLLSLEVKSRRAPIVLELASESEADEIRRALGIGHEGFGWLRWNTILSGATRSGLIGGLLWAFAMLAIMFAHRLVPGGEALVGVFAGLSLMVGFVLTLVHWASFRSVPPPTIGMDANGVAVRDARGVRVVPYFAIDDVRVEPRAIVIVARGETVRVNRALFPWGGDGIGDQAATALVSQVNSAVARARGLGKAKDDRAAQLDALRRGRESPREWLARLDTLGRTLAAGAGYRGTSIDRNDLWSVLEDPDAETELRVAAARILKSAGLPDAKVRIDAAAAAAHDEVAAAEIRVATDDDLDHASRALEVREMHRSIGRT